MEIAESQKLFIKIKTEILDDKLIKKIKFSPELAIQNLREDFPEHFVERLKRKEFFDDDIKFI